ncbi:hypothetical protein Lalb_Chr03g0038851 [Lupinus albus]|uniref:Uncharacterized protein n=1 Tax=Lupinus albus TaxID=3870 RepID=A0A6A4QX06_LUPAL|nr:hypothetical protein Lalb_Chr00c29g0407941 [Lupinus albus]KAE9615597.1 hypothetical protein Lalb_Chr04g0257021 [Lupinus albus]KAE9617766.1 hypothetical protein Lalb_Chr03g0038851 [Lupinus albus]
MAFFRSACEPIGARRLISVEDKQPSSFPSLPLPGPKAVQSFLAKSLIWGFLLRYLTI